VSVDAATNTAKACPPWGFGCNCVPKCGVGPLPDGIPNLITGQVRNMRFDDVTVGGTNIGDVLFGPGFNVSNSTIESLFVDGHRVL
jgi:hypothetical protein